MLMEVYASNHFLLAREVGSFVKHNFNRHVNVVNVDPHSESAQRLTWKIWRQFAANETISTSLRTVEDCHEYK